MLRGLIEAEEKNMSRVGKKPVKVSADVAVEINEGVITVKGKGGELKAKLHTLVGAKLQGDEIIVAAANDSREASAQWGTARQVIYNMVKGVSEGFEKKLTLVGVGYKASVTGTTLNLAVGFSHPVNITMPEGVTVTVPTPTEIVLKGRDAQKVGQIAAEIRMVRAPEPYKGKGIRYFDERVVIKETKKK
jgi:large subunit ribosomal protein L6